VYDDPPEPRRSVTEVGALEANDRDRDGLQAYLDSVLDRVFEPDAAPCFLALCGSADGQLRREVRARRYELLILGAHEREDLFDLHNTVAALIGRCPCQVLVVPAQSLPSAVDV
jgi:nucleotide-binding universal stress UspA family protein